MAKTTNTKGCNCKNADKKEKLPVYGPKLSRKAKRALKNKKFYELKKCQKLWKNLYTDEKLCEKCIEASKAKEKYLKKAKTIDISKAKQTFKDIKTKIENEHPQIKMYKYTPLYLIDTDKEDVDFQQLAAYQCINRNLNSLETINMENNLDKQLKEMYL